MRKVLLFADMERGPGGIRNPVMPFGRAFLQQRIVKRSRKSYVERAVGVQVAELGIANAKFVASEAVGMQRKFAARKTPGLRIL